MPVFIDTQITSAPSGFTKVRLDNAIANLYEKSNTFRTYYDYVRVGGGFNGTMIVDVNQGFSGSGIHSKGPYEAQFGTWPYGSANWVIIIDPDDFDGDTLVNPHFRVRHLSESSGHHVT